MRNKFLQLCIAVLVVWGARAAAATVGTTINYQGRLTSNGNGANGQYDMRFELYNAVTGPSKVGPTVNVAPVSVNSGLFTAPLDFGSGVFDGTAYWLEIGVRPNGSTSAYTVLTPRQPLNSVAHALWAINAGTAFSANGVAINAVSGSGIQDNTIIATKIANGQVVKSLNGLFDNVTLAAGAGVSLMPQGNTLTIGTTLSNSFWSLTGNAGTTPGVNYLGTTDNQPLDLYAGSTRGLRLRYHGRTTGNPPGPIFNTWGMNVLGGLDANSIADDVVGATVAGGGYGSGSFFNPTFVPNSVTADFGAVGGGAGNWVGGNYGVVPGGRGNVAAGATSFASGKWANALHDGCFIWNDATAFEPYLIGGSAEAIIGGWVYDNASTGPNQFRIKASGGVHFSPETSLFCGSQTRQMLNLWRTVYGIGVQANILYCRSDGHFAWYQKGTHSDTYGDPGIGGTPLMSLTESFLTVNGAGNEQAYLGGDGFGGDAQIGSLNPDVVNLAAYNPNRGDYMNMIVKTLTITGGADLAEPFHVSENEIPKGSVVIIDENKPGHLRLSTQAYDTRVAGVVSGANGVQPGIHMKQQGVVEGTQDIALTGRVYVQADASQGAIKPGDLLTTSDIPGHAMKVADHARAQGAILGKAMGALTEGKGTVLVLVTLQ